MDPLVTAYYESKLEAAYLRAKGDNFQVFFEDLMTRAYKTDFMPCRPWGKKGDRKNDGFLKSKRQLFQVYAPNELSEKECTEKIRADFAGARDYWGKLFDLWAFVHNGYDGTPPHVQKEILELEENNPPLKLEVWGLEAFKTVFRQLDEADFASWFGFAPTSGDRANLTFKDLQVVLATIAVQEPLSDYPVKDVPPKKIEANALSKSIATLLKEGMNKTHLLTRFFASWHDPRYGERIAHEFRSKYRALRDQTPALHPNEIFCDLQSWAGGATRGSPEHELAVLTVLAYYFERCDIFEEPRENQT